MVRTVLIIFGFIITLLISLCFMLFVPIIQLLAGKKARMAYVKMCAISWARILLFICGAKVSIQGLENLPDETVLFVSNHQSNLDILFILAYIPRHIGFISKKEVANTPIMNLWMMILHVVLIDRKSLKDSHRGIMQGASHLKNGYNLVIFPEGTRSKGGPLKNFKAGSLKLAQLAHVPIVPVSIEGTYHLLEEKGRIAPGRLQMIIHPSIPADEVAATDTQTLADRLQAQIGDGRARLC